MSCILHIVSFHLVQSMLSAMATGNAGQTTPVQITNAFVLCCVVLHKSHVCYFDCCKSLTTWCVLSNN